MFKCLFWISWSVFFLVWSTFWFVIAVLTLPRHPMMESFAAPMHMVAIGAQVWGVRYWGRRLRAMRRYRRQFPDSNEKGFLY